MKFQQVEDKALTEDTIVHKRVDSVHNPALDPEAASADRANWLTNKAKAGKFTEAVDNFVHNIRMKPISARQLSYLREPANL